MIEDGQRRLHLDPMDILNAPDYRAANLWLAGGQPQPVFTANTKPITDTPQMQAARQHHQRVQHQQGYHPHDWGQYIQPPLIRSIEQSVLARFRAIHVDLTVWPDHSPPDLITRVTIVLYPEGAGEPLGVACEPEDRRGRRYRAQLPEDPQSVGWLPAGRYRAGVLAVVPESVVHLGLLGG